MTYLASVLSRNCVVLGAFVDILESDVDYDDNYDEDNDDVVEEEDEEEFLTSQRSKFSKRIDRLNGMPLILLTGKINFDTSSI